jgi:hypothetical protein
MMKESSLIEGKGNWVEIIQKLANDPSGKEKWSE